MKTKSFENTLKDIYLFKAMNNDEIQSLMKICSIHNYKKDSYLFLKREQSDSLLILTEGIVSIFKNDDKGNKIAIGLFSPTSLLAEPAILQEIPFPSSAVFKEKFLHHAHISYAIIQSLLGKIQLL